MLLLSDFAVSTTSHLENHCRNPGYPVVVSIHFQSADHQYTFSLDLPYGNSQESHVAFCAWFLGALFPEFILSHESVLFFYGCSMNQISSSLWLNDIPLYNSPHPSPTPFMWNSLPRKFYPPVCDTFGPRAVLFFLGGTWLPELHSYPLGLCSPQTSCISKSWLLVFKKVM